MGSAIPTDPPHFNHCCYMRTKNGSCLKINVYPKITHKLILTLAFIFSTNCTKKLKKCNAGGTWRLDVKIIKLVLDAILEHTGHDHNDDLYEDGTSC